MRFVAVSSFVVSAIVASCGGQTLESVCEGVIGPITAPYDVTFTARFGTAVSFSSLPDQTTAIEVFLSAEPDACPTTYITSEPATANHDLHMIGVVVTAPLNGPFTGTYQSCVTGQFVGVGCVSTVFLPQGQTLDSPTVSVWTAWNTSAVTITDFVDGVHVAGTFAGTFQDGSSVSGTFDVPFCTASCGNK